MNVETITMPREAAVEKLAAYEDVLRRTHDDELEAAVEGYRALAAGTPLVDLDDVFSKSPVDKKGRPRLAVARADRQHVRMWWPNNTDRCWFSTENDVVTGWRRPSSNPLCPTLNWDFAMGREHGQMYQSGQHWHGSTLDGFALVPLVPPDVLPQRSYLRKHMVLWEVEEWSDKRLDTIPDRDPYLLTHLGGTLFAVVGEWDLTDLERAVMRGRT